MPISAFDLARKNPVEWICGSSSAAVAFASARASGYRSNSAGVTRFTR